MAEFKGFDGQTSVGAPNGDAFAEDSADDFAERTTESIDPLPPSFIPTNTGRTRPITQSFKPISDVGDTKAMPAVRRASSQPSQSAMQQQYMQPYMLQPDYAMQSQQRSQPSPAFAQPVVAQPAFAQPAFAQPAGTLPAGMQPAAQPAFVQPGGPQPTAVAQPAPTRSGGNFVINWFVKPGKHGVLSSLLWLATIPCVAVMALRVAPNVDQDGRLLPEIIAFVPVLGIVSVVVLLFALIWRRKLLTVVSLACVVIQVMWHIGFFMPTVRISDSARQTVAAAAKTDDNVARLMTLNTKEGNASASDIVRTVRTEHVEVLALQEISDELLGELRAAGLYDVLPYSIVSAPSANDNGGLNGVWTMAPMSNASQSLLPVETSQMPAGTISIGGKLVRFVAAHPNSPTRGLQSLWSEGLGAIGDLKNYQWTYVVMGDFNSTWDHPRFRALLGDRFVDAGEQAGQGFHFTYPSGSRIPPLIEIDHIIHDKGVTVADLATVEISGSDHRALLATLEVA